tara:strand:- start:378 stop:527 length:150 start_codon:yes stop_codon:yes gene_type:complete
MAKKDKMKSKQEARDKAKVRPDETTVDRIYYNMPKKAPAKKTTTKKGKK